MARKGSVLVVDDEEIMRDVLETLLSAEGYRVDLAKTGEEGLECYGRRAYDVVLLDVSMPGMGGLRALEEILKADPEAVVIIITAYATFDTAIGAWERGAFNCIRKPFQNEQIIETVASGIKRRRKEEERQNLRRAMSRSVERGSIIGRSEKMQAIFQLVDQVAPARSTVLITGESGHGQRAHRARHPHAEPARREDLRHRQLLEHPFGAFGVGAVRPHARRLHRRGRREEGAVRGRRRRLHLPRRDRRHPARDAGATAARACRSASSRPSATPRRARWTCASSPPPTSI